MTLFSETTSDSWHRPQIVFAKHSNPPAYMMNQPTHEQISQRAHRLWQESGPEGGDATQNWLDAERELTTAPANFPFGGATVPHSPVHAMSESLSAVATSERAARQKKEARDPKFATHTGPKSMPPESGKPLWTKPHSS
jgi:hypothetical protein